MDKVFIKKNTLGDTRTAEHMPTREEFNDANEGHIDDVKRLTKSFCDEMLERISHHDWTKTSEPYATMFYDNMKANIEDGKEPFTDMEWYKLHVNTERHHLNDHVPDDVDLIDVVERLVDCVLAGMARSGSVYDVTVPDDVLQKAVANTVQKMFNAVIVYESAENSNAKTQNSNQETQKSNGDLIYRADAIDALYAHQDAVRIIKALPPADAKGANLINRHDATTVIREECLKCNNLINADLLGRILALPTSRQTDCTDFILWLVEVVLDDEDWELNAVGYGEIIARKMAKLGLLEVLDGYYIRTPNKPQSVVAEIKIDTDEIIKRIKEEYVFKDEVVRCKDCKYSFYDKDYGNYNCRKHEYVECFDADDYCSWGERND